MISSSLGEVCYLGQNRKFRPVGLKSALSPLATRGPPRPALLRYVRLRDAGLGSVRGVILEREKGSHLDAV
jgi:hypothetical protein